MSTPDIKKKTTIVPKLWRAIHDKHDIDTIKSLCMKTTDQQNDRTDLRKDQNPMIDRRAGKYMTTSLHEAVKTGNLLVVDYLGMMHANFDVVDIGGSTPLHYAAFYDFPKIFIQLLAWNADADIEDKEGRRALERCDRVNKSTKYLAYKQAIETHRKEKQAIFAQVYSGFDVDEEHIHRELSESEDDENMRRAMEASMSEDAFEKDTRNAMANSISQIEMDGKKNNEEIDAAIEKNNEQIEKNNEQIEMKRKEVAKITSELTKYEPVNYKKHRKRGQKSYRERMNERLAKYNLHCHEEGGNPDCWFHCVADQLNRYFTKPGQNNYTFITVRQKVHDYLSKNYKNSDFHFLDEDDLKHFKDPSNPAEEQEVLKQWIETLTTNAWGNMYTTMMVPHIWNIPIRVWMTESPDGRTDDFYDVVPPDYDYDRTDGCIELASIGHIHFQSVRPIRGNPEYRKSPDPSRSGPQEHRSPGHGAGGFQ